MDIKTIPTEELMQDRLDSVVDINLCELALTLGLTADRDGDSYQDRLDVNRKIIQVIDEELARREQEEK